MEYQTIRKNFQFYPMARKDQKSADFMASKLLEIAMSIDRLLNRSREKSMALSRLEECKMWIETALSRGVQK